MKPLFDFIPALLFLFFYIKFDIYAATKVLMVYISLQLAREHFIQHKVNKMTLTTFLLVIPFGAITLFLHNDFFIKLKFSIFYWVLAAALLASHYFYKKNLVKMALEKQIETSEAVWYKMHLAWVLFFIGVGLVNLYFIYMLPSYWIYFKFPGVPIVMMLYMVGIFAVFHKQIKMIENNT